MKLHTLICAVCRKPFSWVCIRGGTKPPLTCDFSIHGPCWKANAKAKRKPMTRLQKDELNYRRKEERRKLRTVNPAPEMRHVIKRVKFNDRPYQESERPVKTYKPGRTCPCGKRLSIYTKGPLCQACEIKKRDDIFAMKKPPARLHTVSGQSTLDHRRQ